MEKRFEEREQLTAGSRVGGVSPKLAASDHSQSSVPSSRSSAGSDGMFTFRYPSPSPTPRPGVL